MLRKILQPFYIVYAALLFVAGLLISFTLIGLVSIGNSPVTRKIIFIILNGWSSITLWLLGIPVKIYGKQPAGRYIVIANHISYLDAANVFAAGLHYFNALGKVELSRIPLFGFLYRQVVIPVDRSSPESRTHSMRRMANFLQQGDILIFPEGTFNETGSPLKEFYDGAFRLAITTQTPILPLVFPDTVDILHYSSILSAWPHRNRAVYLEPIAVAGLTMNDLPALKQKAYEQMRHAIINYRAM